ncbi:MAG: DEAD/DEAH box helicase family protein [Alphaproteobacteria bacterium]|uniref:DEAD/DEAH box helicase family protein n=1 Tax=Candidatus Nitrobium versatile TaxID=2884831 RepID=A0A953J277_9BACT|nr:DEAD/DEAH box helicase family protein [Candidatus Nitrobium versatile]
MVDFKKLVKKEKTVDWSNLVEVFESLDRQTSHIDLRPVQLQALELISKKRSEKEIILKVSTGSGKTSVALLFLLSHMEEKGQPVVYLCPTIQLVKQVIEEATKLGIRAVEYPKGEKYPDVDGTAGKAVIVCTYDKLFNAKSTFNRPDVNLRPCAIVCDDAHAGVEEIRDSFTLRISNEELLYKEITNILGAACEAYDIGKWSSIINKDPQAIFEVPYWIWHSLNEELHRLLSPHAEDGNFMFVWPYLSDILRRCRCIISWLGIEIVPEIIPIHKVEAFAKTPHRLFMSATLADDSILIRELGCDYLAAKLPLTSEGDKGLGERMVIAPSLVDKDLNREWVMKLCQQISKQNNVVVLSPSEWAAREWESVGATVFIGDEVVRAVEQLRSKEPSVRFAVFVQRYDGVDLPDNACRILVLDGMPYGEGIVDKFDSSITAGPGGIRNRLVYRIEQGIGRAVRSHVDYAVVILSGHDIAHFIAKRDVLSAMSQDTAAQLRLALDLAELAREDSEDASKSVIALIGQCLKRNEGWKQYYAEHMKKSREEKKKPDEVGLQLAYAERKAFEYAVSRQYDKAVETIRHKLNELTSEEITKGWYLQKIAAYMNEIDSGEAMEIQQAAREINPSLLCPPSITRRSISASKTDVQGIIVAWFSEFENPNGAIAAIEDLRARLSFQVTTNTFEEAIKELATMLGAEGRRPEREDRDGPDGLWLFPEISLVIEAKTENEASLHKSDSGQLHTSIEWFSRSYKARPAPIPVAIAKIDVADAGSNFPEGTRVLLPVKLQELLNNLISFYRALIKEPPLLRVPHKIAELSVQHKIAPEQIIGTYTVKIKEKKK